MAPRRHRDPAVVVAKLARRREPHVAPLLADVERLRAERGGGESVPWFDPDDGRVKTRILILGEAPGARATGTDSPRPAAGGSGFVSADNDDQTAADAWALLREAGLGRNEVVTWNIVPWYVGDGTRIRPVTVADLDEAYAPLRELIALLPELRVVLLYGRAAAKGWTRLGIDVPAVEAPHPSPRNLNSRPQARAAILAAMRGIAIDRGIDLRYEGRSPDRRAGGRVG